MTKTTKTTTPQESFKALLRNKHGVTQGFNTFRLFFVKYVVESTEDMNEHIKFAQSIWVNLRKILLSFQFGLENDDAFILFMNEVSEAPSLEKRKEALNAFSNYLKNTDRSKILIDFFARLIQKDGNFPKKSPFFNELSNQTLEKMSYKDYEIKQYRKMYPTLPLIGKALNKAYGIYSNPQPSHSKQGKKTRKIPHQRNVITGNRTPVTLH